MVAGPPGRRQVLSYHWLVNASELQRCKGRLCTLGEGVHSIVYFHHSILDYHQWKL